MWTKDAVSQAPKIVYTRDQEVPGYPNISTAVYDPEAPVGQRWVLNCNWLHKADETLEFVESLLGF